MCLGSLLMFAVLFFSLPLTAKGLDENEELTDYISKVCKRNCVDPQLLLMAVQAASLEYNVSPKQILAIMRVESSFVVKAKNSRSVGLMQVNLKYHAKSFRASPYDVFENVDTGTSIYNACLKKKRGDVPKALRCYNGEGKQNVAYSNKVLKALSELKSISIT